MTVKLVERCAKQLEDGRGRVCEPTITLQCPVSGFDSEVACRECARDALDSTGTAMRIYKERRRLLKEFMMTKIECVTVGVGYYCYYVS